MTLAVSLHADAAAELEAAVWYDDQREGLGLQLLASVNRAIQHAREWPHTGALVDELPPDLVVRRSPSVAPIPGRSNMLPPQLGRTIASVRRGRLLGGGDVGG